MHHISPNTRLRVSPYYSETLKDGARSFTPYNNMLLPISYGDPQAEYDRLMTGVAMWDVSVQRQVRIRGRDAARLTRLLCVRDLSACEVAARCTRPCAITAAS